MSKLIVFAVGITLALNTSGIAQSLPSTSFGSWESPYPGAVFVTPQDSSFLAPGIYRSIGKSKKLTNPIEVVQICVRDFRETSALKALHSGVSEASGITDVVHKNFGAKITGFNLKYVKLGANLEVKDEATFTATPLRVLSADDDISEVVLTNIQAGCKKIIRSHLRQGRLIFIAAKAIQAKDFNITLNIGPKADAGFTCTIPILCTSETGISGNFDGQRQLKRSAVQPVTFGLVPAEISNGRVSVTESDIK